MDFSRRHVLGLGSGALACSLAGCQHESIPFVGGSVPPLEAAWLSVRESGNAAFALEFDGDVITALERAPISKGDLLNMAAENEVEMTFESVDIEGVSQDSDRVLDGRIRKFSDTKSWPIGTWFSTSKITYTKTLPEKGRAPLHVRFPDGGGFTLPDAHERSTTYYDDEDASLFAYGDAVPKRTFPHVTYLAHPDLTAVRAAAEYRFRVVKRLHDYYDIGWYQERAMEDIRSGVSELVAKLGKAGVESLITSPLPSGVTAPLEVKGVNDALQSDLPKLQSGLDSLERGLNASVNESWMADFRGTTDGKRGFLHLGTLGQAEWSYRNPRLATANDNDAFVEAFRQYQSLVDKQREITSRLRSSESIFSTVQPFGGEYWQHLYDLAHQLVRKFDRQLAATSKVLTEIQNEIA